MKRFISYIILLTLTLSLVGCGKSNDSGSVADSGSAGSSSKKDFIMFTDLKMGGTKEDTVALYGDPREIWQSSLLHNRIGDIYIYETTYMDVVGTLAVYINPENEIHDMIWTYDCEDAKEILSMYKKQKKSLEHVCGTSGTLTETDVITSSDYSSSIWYMDQYEVSLSAIQYDSDLYRFYYRIIDTSNR